MRLIGGAFLLTVLSLSATTPTPANAHQDYDDEPSPSSSLLRGTSKNLQAQASQLNTAELLFPIFDPLQDFVRTGLDRSLSYIHDSELNLPLSPEVTAAIGEYITKYSIDGNDDNTDTCVFDYDDDVDLNESSYGGRALQQDQDQDDHTVADHGGHSEHDYVESACNADLDTAVCINWSDYWTLEEPLADSFFESEVKIPCGECVTLDASPGGHLYGTTIEFGQGLNVVGKLVIPNDAKVHLRTKYIYVQGVLSMPEPPSGSSNGIPSEVDGDRVEITLYGKDDLMFKADAETDNHHHEAEGVHNKAIVIAGGRLDIHAMDPTCPSWVKLQSIEYGTPLPNLALNKPAIESSTFDYWQGQPTGHSASQAVDDNEQSYTHTKCWTGINQWWQVDLEDMYSIQSMEIVNRLDWHGDRLHDYDIFFMDSTMTVVHEIHVAGQNGNKKQISIPSTVNAQYVKIQLRDRDCLQLGEVRVYGFLSSEDGFPLDYWDKLTLGDAAARCWQTKGSQIMLTSDTYAWGDSHTALVEGSPSAGVLAVHPLAKKKTAIDETFGYPDFAVEVALLDRKLVIKGEKETGDHEKIGGHLIVLHTPMVKQHLEGGLFTNFGQQTRLGRYPLHFHMSECVHGSTLAKNVIWKSNQRCIVVHGTHNLTLSENVAYDTMGHCFMLEDGGEWHNVFYRNLGALTKPPVGWNNEDGLIRPGESDHFPATFWITNPANDFVDNVAAGSRSTGIWFDLKIRAPSSALAINLGSNPKAEPQGKFEGNVAHSNGFRAGITTYESGYHAPPGTTWKNIKSYKNSGGGLFQHGTNNIIFEGGLLADNTEAARNFHHKWAVYDGVEIIGRSEHAQSLIDQGRLSDNCERAGGISVQPNDGMGAGTTIKNSKFSGFNVCTGNKNYAIWYENEQVRNGVVDAVHTILNNTYGDNDNRLSACRSILTPDEGDVRLVAMEDPDGSMAGVPGFYIQNHESITNFIDEASCQAEEGCLRFCPGVCLRLGTVTLSQALTTRGYNMVITDTDSQVTGTIARGSVWFDELQNFLNTQIPFQLPAPATKYQISFTDKNGDPAWPGYAKIYLEKAPACTGALVDESQIELAMPPSDDIRCHDLFHEDDYPQGIHGWQNFFAGIKVSREDTSWVISTKRRTSDANPACNLSRTLDASCFPGNSGRTYSLFGKIRITDANGDYVATPGTSELQPWGINHVSPRVSLILDGVKTWSWFVKTTSDGTWTDWSVDVILPDTSAVWKATITIDQAQQMQFHIKDWGMTLNPSESPTISPIPTTSPSEDPSISPSKGPSLSPTLSPSRSPTSPTSLPTSLPTLTPQTAAPVSQTPTNLALATRGSLASANTECVNQWARNAIDGIATGDNRYEGCMTAGSFIMVDLGKDTLNHIDSVIIKNRCDCCGGRLKRFHVEVLDAAKNVVWSQYHADMVGICVAKTFQVNEGEGALGRWVRLRYDESYTEIMHIAELEAWGYPVSVPSNPPEIYDLAQGLPAQATQSTTYDWRFSPKNALDGDTNTITHTHCWAHPWWEVDLGVESFVRDVWITNRVNCCGGRLRDATVALLDSDRNVVETRYIKGAVGNGREVRKVFNEDTSFGRYIKISMNRNDCLHLTEVQVWGYHNTPSLVNLSVGKPAIESSTFDYWQGQPTGHSASQAVDDNDQSYTHTKCWTGINQWWQVDLESSSTIVSIQVVNRLNGHQARLHDYTIGFYDDTEVLIDSKLVAGPNWNFKTVSIDSLQGVRFVRITNGDMDCLSLGEVRVIGWYD